MAFDKKLLFNGCSFVAGDEIVWDQFCEFSLLKNPIEYTWDKFHKDKVTFNQEYPNYTAYRKNFNLSATFRNTFDSVTDLSKDGNSNTRIALSVIKTLSEMEPKEAKNFHVCVGWTVPPRHLRWSENQRRFISVNPGHYNDDNYRELHPYIKEALVNVSRYDHDLHYIHNVMLLENFLKLNGITYTFWRGLGKQGDSEDTKEKLFPELPLNKISDKSCWISFDKDDSFPMLGMSWANYLWTTTDPYPWISKNNHHPNLKSVTEMSKRITNHIQSKFLDKN